MLSQRRLSRRSVLTGLAGVAAGSVVGACGGANTPGGTTVLQVWGAVPPESGPGDVIAAFERKFPKIKIDYTRFVNDPQGNVKLDTALQGGTPIDVFFSYNPGLLTQRVRAGLAVDLTDRIKAEPAFAPMADPAKPQSIWFDGRLFSVVTVRDPFVVFVNQNMLDAAGLTIPDQWTIEDFNRIAQTLARPDQGVYGMLSGSYPDSIPYTP